jgi:hypothetical protein
VVGAHHLDGARREQAHAPELSALQQHLAEPRVVGGGREQSAATRRAGRHDCRIRPVLVDRQVRAGAGVHLRQAREFVPRHLERGVPHAERLEDTRAQEVGERLTGELLD